ncbi:MAG: hypothetical protein CL608_09370 [Anaerolineaceae bacterium]|nr:hypothetical protein [Anaerolineaceae bacterium]
MVWVFFDASALAKRYAPEIGSDFINELFLQFPVEQMTISMIGVSEIDSVQFSIQKLPTFQSYKH